MEDFGKLLNICKVHGVRVEGSIAIGDVLDMNTNIWETETFDLSTHSMRELYGWLGY